jgi:metal-dependent amidase/aminoacylase/carboxypeptidase family protein
VERRTIPRYEHESSDRLAINTYLPAQDLVAGGPIATGASSDMGNVSHVVPSLHPQVPVPSQAGTHTPGFAATAATPEAHEIVIGAAKALSQTALDVLRDPDFLHEVQASFQPR